MGNKPTRAKVHIGRGIPGKVVLQIEIGREKGYIEIPNSTEFRRFLGILMTAALDAWPEVKEAAGDTEGNKH